MRRASIAKLVIKNDGRLVCGGEIGEWRKIVIGETWTTMQNDNWSAGFVEDIAKYFIVGLIRIALIFERNIAFEADQRPVDVEAGCKCGC